MILNRAPHEADREDLAAIVTDAAAHAPALAERLAAAGVAPADLTDPAALAAVPVMTKDDLLRAQRERPPFGGLMAPGARPRRLFQSPGPLYEPQPEGPDPWRWGTALAALGVGDDDVLLNCFGYHLSPAGAMFEEGALARGATTVPGGIGGLDLQARLVADLGVTSYTGLPSYLKALIERYDAEGLDPESWRLRRALVTAEPLPDSLRALLTARIPDVHMAYGTAETGLLGYETAPHSGLKIAPGVIVQVCDLDTGAPREDEGEGQIVVTLRRRTYPLIRFGTGDLSAWSTGPDGEPRLVGVLGRVGDAVKVRGMFLHPRQARAALEGTPGLAAFRFVVDRVDHRDLLRCEIEGEPGADHADLAARVHARVRAALRFDAQVAPVASVGEGALIEDTRDWS